MCIKNLPIDPKNPECGCGLAAEAALALAGFVGEAVALTAAGSTWSITLEATMAVPLTVPWTISVSPVLILETAIVF